MKLPNDSGKEQLKALDRQASFDVLTTAAYPKATWSTHKRKTS